MNTLLIKYKPLWLSALITTFGVIILALFGFIRIPDDAPMETTLIFGFWWLAIALGIFKFGQLKNKKQFISHLMTLIFLMASAIFVDTQMNYPDNPLTFSILVTFWIYLSYILAPRFFNKYRFLIIGSYGFICLYFTYVRYYLAENNAYREYLFPAFLLPIPVFILLWIYEQWKDYQTLKAEKSKAELALLKSQINPHFFFNTLNNLYSLTVSQSKKAPEVIVKLSEMMRYTIYEGKKDQVTLKEEIDYLKNYIELHEIRHHRKVDIDFEESVSDNIQIAPLLFIILLENAFKHGVESLTGGAFVHLSIANNEHQIIFKIKNNFAPDEQFKTPGIGLSNLKKRLALIYPDQHELNIDKKEDTFEVTLTIDTSSTIGHSGSQR